MRARDGERRDDHGEAAQEEDGRRQDVHPTDDQQTVLVEDQNGDEDQTQHQTDALKKNAESQTHNVSFNHIDFTHNHR